MRLSMVHAVMVPSEPLRDAAKVLFRWDLNHYRHGEIVMPHGDCIGTIDQVERSSTYEVRDRNGVCVWQLLQTPGGPLVAAHDPDGRELVYLARPRWLSLADQVMVDDLAIGSRSRLGKVRDSGGTQMLRVKRTALMTRREVAVTFTPGISLPWRVLGYALAVQRGTASGGGA